MSRLQPLRIPSGWTVVWNSFEDVQPDTWPENDRAWLGLTEDLLYLYHTEQRRRNHRTESFKLSIDLGWYPDCNPRGGYTLLALLDDDYDKPMERFCSRSTQAVVERLEQWLQFGFKQDIWRAWNERHMGEA